MRGDLVKESKSGMSRYVQIIEHLTSPSESHWLDKNRCFDIIVIIIIIINNFFIFYYYFIILVLLGISIIIIYFIINNNFFCNK